MSANKERGNKALNNLEL